VAKTVTHDISTTWARLCAARAMQTPTPMNQANDSGVPRILIYIGALVAINIVLYAVDAPFWVY
jgi:hypothetical protein